MTPETLTFPAALVAGLVGSSHCLGMCGGIAAALGMGTAGPDAGAGTAVGRALLYNGGLLQRRSLPATFLLGAMWGWLPCGLVYGMLLAAAASGGPLHGAGTMIAFGLGTAPAMVATGAAGGWFQRLSRDAHFRRIAGLLVVALGLLAAAWPLAMQSMRMG